METQRFDDFVRSWAAGGTRRAALRLLAGGGLAALLAGRPGEAAADCPRRRRCGQDCCRSEEVCLGGRCRAKGPCGDAPCLGKRCGSDEDFCFCTSSVEGIGFCLDGFAASCTRYEPCTSSRQCPDGLCLATADCCGGKNLCVPRSKACPSGTGRVRPWE